MARKPYPGDVTDEEWDFVTPYVTLMTEDAPQREHDLREVFNAMRWAVRTGSPWRYMPNGLPPWQAVYQQSQRWLASGVFEAIPKDLRQVLRLLEGRREEPTAAIFDSRTLQSTPGSGGRAGYDGAKRKGGSKVHMAVDTPGYYLSLHATAADEQDRAVGSATWPKRCRRRPAGRSNWRTWIEVTPARRRPRRRRSRRSNCRS